MENKMFGAFIYFTFFPLVLPRSQIKYARKVIKTVIQELLVRKKVTAKLARFCTHEIGINFGSKH